MTDDDDVLFSGVEDVAPADRGDVAEPSSDGPTLDPVALANELSWDEVHSFTIGFAGTLFATVLTVIGTLLASSVAPLAVATWIAVALLALAALGQRRAPRRLRYIPREPHLFFTGTTAALLLSIALLVPLTPILIASGVIA